MIIIAIARIIFIVTEENIFNKLYFFIVKEQFFKIKLNIKRYYINSFFKSNGCFEKFFKFFIVHDISFVVFFV